MFKSNDRDWTWQLLFDPKEIEERQNLLQTFYTGRTNFSFLNDHYGLRPGCLHTLLGAPGRGKSSLVQSLLLEWAKTQPVLVYLTEEGRDQLETKLARMEPMPAYLSTKLHVISEEDDVLKHANPSEHRDLLELLDIKIKASGAKILVIDNITTSAFYEGQFQNIQALISGFKTLARRNEIPIFFVCHPKRGTNESKGLYCADDIRGSAFLGMTTEYFYALYRYSQTSQMGTTVHGTFVYVIKSRHHENQDSVYRLDYDLGLRRYMKDKPVNFDAFKEFVKNRDKL